MTPPLPYTHAYAGRDAAKGRVFIELAAAEPPATINLFPKPGTYRHPEWGDIEVTQAGNQEFIKNFDAHVYQEHIPIDAEHETKLSGALGYLKRLKMNDDGSVEAEVEWTDRGTQLIEQDSYKYVSPEWFEEWNDPATKETHHNVIAGAALTTRPFFKEAALRPLVASEGVLYDIDPVTQVRTACGVDYYSPPSRLSMLTDTLHSLARFDDVPKEAARALMKDIEDELAKEASTTAREARDFTPEQRDQAAKKKEALPDGSFPIANKADLQNAISAYGRAKNKPAAKRHIITRARALKLTALLPADWEGSTKKEATMAVLTNDEQSTLRTLLNKVGLFKGHEEGEPPPDDKEDADKPDEKPEDKKDEPDADADKQGDKPEGDAPVTASEIKRVNEELETERKARKALETQVATLRATERDARFRSLILGQDEASRQASEKDGQALHPMVGDLAAKLQLMRTLADMRGGEESAEFKTYVASEREHARQLHDAGLFAERGVNPTGEPVARGAKEQIDQKVAALRTAEPALSPEDALTRIASENPRLYDEYDREITGRKTRFA